MILKTFENFSDNKHLEDSADKFLTNLGHYKDDEGFWWVGEELEIRNDWVINGKLIIKFAEVRGDLNAERRGLKSLEGFPKVIKGHLSLIGNKLENFNNSPIWKIDGTLYASQNNLTSLEGLPETVGNLYYHNNIKLETLYGAPISLKTDAGLQPSYGTLIPESERVWYYKYYKGEKGNDYWLSLLKFILNNEEYILREENVKWPDGFLTNDVIRSVKGLNKFKL